MKFKGTIENGEDTSVQVAVRVRPISSNENQNGDETSVEVLSDTSCKNLFIFNITFSENSFKTKTIYI